MSELTNDKNSAVYITKGKLADGARLKKLYGKFFTVSNPFNIDIFFNWLNVIPDKKKNIVIEPFAGSNNIVRMISLLGIHMDWACYDIDPPKKNNMSQYCIRKKDTIKNFPRGFATAITNPPYLAKNSATRNGLPYPDTNHDDVYKLCLDVMLQNLEYVAAIVPESFITAAIFHERLFAVSSLTCKMFADTDCPVCLSLFIPKSIKAETGLNSDDFRVYSQDKYLGLYKSLSLNKLCIDQCSNQSFSLLKAIPAINWSFNDPAGKIGIRCIDDTSSPTINFMHGSKIPASSIKHSSRSLTRVSGLPKTIKLDDFLNTCNELLDKYRKKTCDVFLTSFKGLRKDGYYRRRLDFHTAKNIMNYAIYKTI